VSKKFEGREVQAVAVKVSGKVLDLPDGTDVKVGDTLYVVVEGEVQSIEHRRIRDTNGVQRRAILLAQVGAVVDGDLVKEAIDTERDRLRLIEEQREGVLRFPTVDDDAAEGGE
jgi:hypothetical protein